MKLSLRRLGNIMKRRRCDNAGARGLCQDEEQCKARDSNSRHKRFETQNGTSDSSVPLAEEARMQQRWSEATKTCSVIDLHVDDLKQLVYSGMPMKYRTYLWREWGLNRSISLADMEKLSNFASVTSISDIVQDVPRTQPMSFKDAQVVCLQRVLQAYAGWNPTIGYCQGMNFMAAVFVGLGFSDVEAFTGLTFLVEEICVGFHRDDLSGFHRDSVVLEKLVARFLPSVHEELASIGVPISLLAIDHFMTLGSRNWPLASVVRLWDVIFMEGSPAMFGSFLALLELYIPVGNGSRKLGTNASDDMLTVPDVMDIFKRDSSRGVTQELDVIMTRVRRYVQLIPEAWVAELRESVAGIP